MYFFSYSHAVWTRKAGRTLDTGDVSPATTLLELRWATWADNLAHNFSHNQQFKKSSLKAVGVWAVFISAHAGAFSYCSSPNQTVCVVWSLGNSALSSPPRPRFCFTRLRWGYTRNKSLPACPLSSPNNRCLRENPSKVAFTSGVSQQRHILLSVGKLRNAGDTSTLKKKGGGGDL